MDRVREERQRATQLVQRPRFHHLECTWKDDEGWSTGACPRLSQARACATHSGGHVALRVAQASH
eukprot:12666552-Alexandrium_andersonii.AAC.1